MDISLLSIITKLTESYCSNSVSKYISLFTVYLTIHKTRPWTYRDCGLKDLRIISHISQRNVMINYGEIHSSSLVNDSWLNFWMNLMTPLLSIKEENCQIAYRNTGIDPKKWNLLYMRRLGNEEDPQPLLYVLSIRCRQYYTVYGDTWPLKESSTQTDF